MRQSIDNNLKYFIENSLQQMTDTCLLDNNLDRRLLVPGLDNMEALFHQHHNWTHTKKVIKFNIYNTCHRKKNVCSIISPVHKTMATFITIHLSAKSLSWWHTNHEEFILKFTSLSQRVKLRLKYSHSSIRLCREKTKKCKNW